MKDLRCALSVLAFILSGPLPLHSQEISLAEFQTKIKKTYYSIEKEGLEGFQCDLQSALVEKKLAEAGLAGFSQGLAKIALGLEYTLTVGPQGVQVTCPKASPTGNAKDDQAIREGKEKARYWLEKGLGTWIFLSCPMVPGQVGGDSPTVEKTPMGWKMSLLRGEDRAVLYFDQGLIMTHADLYPKREEPVRVKMAFAKGPKGLQLQAAQARYQGKIYRAQAEYIKTRGAFLPEKFVFSQVDPKSKAVSVLDTLAFENYEVER